MQNVLLKLGATVALILLFGRRVRGAPPTGGFDLKYEKRKDVSILTGEPRDRCFRRDEDTGKMVEVPCGAVFDRAYDNQFADESDPEFQPFPIP